MKTVTIRCRILFAVLLMPVPLLVGCGVHQPPREEAPALDPKAAAAAAMDQYDENKDGAIAGAELDKIPGIKSQLKQYAGPDGKVTADTIAARLAHWQESKIGIMAANIQVWLDGKPLEGATVTLEPEKFLGSAIEPAKGVTGPSGFVAPQIQGKPGVRVGLYKVLVSKTDGGKELIPAKYNTATTLGIEVDPANFGLGPPKFDLTSK